MQEYLDRQSLLFLFLFYHILLYCLDCCAGLSEEVCSNCHVGFIEWLALEQDNLSCITALCLWDALVCLCYINSSLKKGAVGFFQYFLCVWFITVLR